MEINVEVGTTVDETTVDDATAVDPAVVGSVDDS